MQNLTIEGAGPGQTVIDACKLGDRALQIMPGASVTLKDLTITNGHAQDGTNGSAGASYGSEGGAADPGASGGAILNQGNPDADRHCGHRQPRWRWGQRRRGRSARG